ncbi:MAG: hypothetical protein F4Y14_21605, partial [Acidobacteria bacterium]|nr:hypothetical protein [Acidobacteriota bacterium]
MTVAADDPCLVGDPTGDSLDALLCAVQAAWAWRNRSWLFGNAARVDPLEGWIADPRAVKPGGRVPGEPAGMGKTSRTIAPVTGTAANEPSQDTRDWIAARERTGNWYDIARSEQIPADVTPPFRTILHMFQLAFAPEVRRRRADGAIEDGFVLRMAQLLQREGRPREVRLNDEVRGTALTRVDRPVSPADPVYLADLVALEDFELDATELDAGHFTLFGVDGHWRAVFDFRSGRGKAGDLLAAAAEHGAAAQGSGEQGDGSVGGGPRFSAC